MCGIIGYCGKQIAAPLVFEGLKRVEYRGYDSAGIATLSDGQLFVSKDTGNLEKIESKHNLSSLPGNIAIGHTRWATHGGVTLANAHPHCAAAGTIAVVHNGIVENYQELRQHLISTGHRFASETDTEVIPHLIEEEMKKGASLKAAVLAVAPRLEGSYAFLAISSRDSGKIVATRKDNPLAIGVGEKGNFIASDALAFSGLANQLIPLANTEIAVIKATEIELFDAKGNELPK